MDIYASGKLMLFLEAGERRLIVAGVPMTASAAAGARVVPPPVAAPTSSPASPSSAVVALRVSAAFCGRSPVPSVVFT